MNYSVNINLANDNLDAKYIKNILTNNNHNIVSELKNKIRQEDEGKKFRSSLKKIHKKSVFDYYVVCIGLIFGAFVSILNHTYGLDDGKDLVGDTRKACSALLGTTGPSSECVQDLIPLIDALYDRPKVLLNNVKQEGLKDHEKIFVVSSIFAIPTIILPLINFGFDQLASLRHIAQGNSLVKAAFTFVRTMTSTMMLICFGMMINVLFVYLSKKYLDANKVGNNNILAFNPSDSSSLKNLISRIVFAACLVTPAMIILPRLQQYINNIFAAQESTKILVNFNNYIFSSWLLCFGVSCLGARLLAPMIREYFVTKAQQAEKLSPMQITLCFFMASYSLFSANSYFARHFTYGPISKQVCLSVILSLAIITNITFFALIFTAAEKSQSPNSQKTCSLDNLNSSGENLYKRQIILPSVVIASLIGLVFYQQNSLAPIALLDKTANFVRNPVVFTSIMLYCVYNIIVGVLRAHRAILADNLEKLNDEEWIDKIANQIQQNVNEQLSKQKESGQSENTDNQVGNTRDFKLVFNDLLELQQINRVPVYLS